MSPTNGKFDTNYRRTDRKTFNRIASIIRTSRGSDCIEQLNAAFAAGAPVDAYMIDTNGGKMRYLGVAMENANGDALAHLIDLTYQQLLKSDFYFGWYMRYPQVLEVLIDHGHSFDGLVEAQHPEFLSGALQLDTDYLFKATKQGANFECLVDAHGLKMPPITQYAIGQVEPIVLEQLLAAGVSPATRATGGMSVLHGAVTHGKQARAKEIDSDAEASKLKRVSEAVIAAGASIDMVDDQGRSALHAACKMGYFNKARILMEAGADCHLKDKDGNTPVDLARAAKRRNVLQLFASIQARTRILDVVAKAAAAAKPNIKP